MTNDENLLNLNHLIPVIYDPFLKESINVVQDVNGNDANNYTIEQKSHNIMIESIKYELIYAFCYRDDNNLSY